MPAARRVATLIATAALAGLAVGAPAPARADDSSQCDPQTRIAEEPWTSAALDIPAANRIATGKGVVVAIVDSGVDAGNPHLMGAVLPGVNYVNDGTAADGTEDVMGHGTALAGVIAAREIPGSGVKGIAPDAKILPVRVLRSDSDQDRAAGHGPKLALVAQGIRYATDHGAKIINVSISDTDDISEVRSAVEYATDNGSLVVASAGNRLTTMATEDSERYPAGYPQALGVAAVTNKLAATDNAIHGAQVDVAAPGQSVESSQFKGIDCVFSNDKAQSSFSTAYASGAAALLAQRYPSAGPAGWRERLMVTADRQVADKRDDEVGWGLIQPYDALTMVIDSSVPGAADYRSPTPAATQLAIDTGPRPGARTRGLVGAVLGGAAVVWVLLLTAASTRAYRRAHPT